MEFRELGVWSIHDWGMDKKSYREVSEDCCIEGEFLVANSSNKSNTDVPDAKVHVLDVCVDTADIASESDVSTDANCSDELRLSVGLFSLELDDCGLFCG